MEGPLKVPDIYPENLASFHDAHFSATSTGHFAQEFLGPVEEPYPDEADDDGLGYYSDGVKRTLTDEQIAIFRHSEIQSLLRKKRRAEEERSYREEYISNENISEGGQEESEQAKDPEIQQGELESGEPDEGEAEDGEVLEEGSNGTVAEAIPASSNKNTSRKASKKSKNNIGPKAKGFFRHNIKPDLRKRTWDKVETGTVDLSYDEEERGKFIGPIKPSQRRRIAYEDG